MKKILTLFLVTYTISLYPCYNEYEDIYGINRSDDAPDMHIGTMGVYEPELYDYIAINLYKVDQLEKEASDVAIAYVFLHNYKRGLQITSKLITKYPGEYNVLITHAVCLELNGQPEQALIYIKKAVDINPDSHWGSEWIHIKILEQVISGADLQGKSILGLNFGMDSIPVLQDTTIDIKKTLTHLEYQLEDRGFFVDSNDIIYGSLVFDFANLLYLQGEILSSQQYYEQAANYGFQHPALQSRINHVKNWANQTVEERADKYAEKVHDTNTTDVEKMSTQNLLVLALSLLSVVVIPLLFLRLLLKKRHA
jgi:tetratricopeptide (TPR) repeat protein